MRRVRRSRRRPPTTRSSPLAGRRPARGCAQPQPDPRHQLGEAERLGHVVVGAAVEGGDRVGDRVAGGEHDDRHPAALGAQLVEDLEAVHAGQADVEHHQVEAARERLVEAGRSVGGDGRLVALGPQALGHERGDALLVLDDQDLGHGFSSVAGTVGGRSVDARRGRPRGCGVVDARPSPPWASSDGADDGQAEAEALVAGAHAAAAEALEHRLAVLGVDAVAGVAHPEPYAVGRRGRTRWRSRRRGRCA